MIKLRQLKPLGKEQSWLWFNVKAVLHYEMELEPKNVISHTLSHPYAYLSS